MPELRVVSYNIHSLRDDRLALVQLVRELAPDVLLLQEAPRRFGWRARCAALAHSLGLVVAAGGLPGLGNLILTDVRVRVERTWCQRFPLTPGRHLRGAVVARCVVARTPFTVIGSHLSTDPAEGPGQARLLAEAVAAAPPPVVLGADLNDAPGGPVWKTLVDHFSDPGGAPTFPSAGPERRIDAVLAGPGIEVVDYRVVETPLARRASDHLPVVADLRLPG